MKQRPHAPYRRILGQEQSLDADPIVMEELLPGSVTRHVLAYSSSDVFVAGQSR